VALKSFLIGDEGLAHSMKSDTSKSSLSVSLIMPDNAKETLNSYHSNGEANDVAMVLDALQGKDDQFPRATDHETLLSTENHSEEL
jgi:hypothetical protein